VSSETSVIHSLTVSLTVLPTCRKINSTFASSTNFFTNHHHHPATFSIHPQHIFPIHTRTHIHPPTPATMDQNINPNMTPTGPNQQVSRDTSPRGANATDSFLQPTTMDQDSNPNSAPSTPAQPVSRNNFPRGANETDNITQTTQTSLTPKTAKPKKDSAPLISWTKEMNFAVAIAAEHQKFSLGGVLKTRWPAVFLIINRIYKRFPKFVVAYPNGFKNPDKLRSQFGDRDREHEKHKGELAKKNWKFDLASCSTAEVQAMHAIADDEIKVEQELSLVKDSIVRDPGVNALRWITYEANTTKAAKTKGTKRPIEASDNAQSDAPVKVARRRGVASKPVVEEDEDEDQDSQPDDASDSPAPEVLLGRRRANETPAEANLRHQAAKGRVRGGARQIKSAILDSYTNNDEDVEEDSSAVPHSGDVTTREGSAGYAYTTDNGSFLGLPNYSITTTQVAGQGGSSAALSSAAHSSVPSLDTFARALLILEASGKLPMMHSSVVDFTSDHPVVVVREPSLTITDLESELNMFGAGVFEDEEIVVPYQGPVDVEFVVGFVSQTSRVYSLAGLVCRVEFRDATSTRHRFADFMLCTPSTCGVCCGGELAPAALLNNPRADRLPMVRRQDIIHLEGNWCFLPVGPEDQTLEGTYRSTNRAGEVVFDRRRVQVEIFHTQSKVMY
jgi:hypothetical protein